MSLWAKIGLCFFFIAAVVAGPGRHRAIAEAKVDLWRILQQHHPTIVTTESAADLQRVMLKWEGVPELRVMPISEFAAKKASKGDLPPDGDVLFVIDRSKKELITPEIEALLPFPTSAIASDEVLSYVSKTASKRSRSYGNGWEMLVSSPNNTWLIDELEHAPEVFKARVNEKTPTKLHWFRVRTLHIVSTEGQPGWLTDWVKRQQVRVKLGDVIEPTVIPVEEWDPATANAVDPTTNNAADLMFLLNRNKLGAKESAVLGALPQSIQSWWAADGSKREVAVQRQVTPDSGGRERVVGGVISPCGRHLDLALRNCPAWGQIPQTLQRKELKDLSLFPEMIVVPRTSGEKSSKEATSLSDFCGKMATALGNGTGFRCSTRADLKDVIYTAVEAEAAGRISSTDVQKIRGKAPGAMALLVADLVSIDERTAYEDTEPRCVTQAFPKFDKSKPSEPDEPKPDDRKGLFSGHRYDEVNGPGTRAQDPHYINDHNNWRDVKMPSYREDLRKWEYEERDYERKRQSHEMYWEVCADQVEAVKLSGNLRVYDIRSADIATGGELIYSSSITGEAGQRGQWKKDRVRVIGEGGKPDTLQKPEPKEEGSATLRSKAFENAAARAIEELAANAVLPDCGGAGAAPAPETNGKTSETQKISIAVEGKGSVVLSQAKGIPAGKQLDDARKAALTLALQEIMDNAKRECPTFAMSEDEVREKAVFVKDHWDPRLKVYTARFSFTTEQAAGDSQTPKT